MAVYPISSLNSELSTLRAWGLQNLSAAALGSRLSAPGHSSPGFTVYFLILEGIEGFFIGFRVLAFFGVGSI